MTRPTKSRTLYTQRVGRGLRKSQGKQDCIVIDFKENREDVFILPSLFTLPARALEKGESVLLAVAKCEKQISADRRLPLPLKRAMDFIEDYAKKGPEI